VRPKTLVLKTASKAHGLPAARVGYTIAVPETLRPMRKLRPMMNVNGFGASGLAARARLAEGEALDMPGRIRISLGRPDENDKLIAELRTLAPRRHADDAARATASQARRGTGAP